MSRYRETFSNLLNEIRIVEQMKTIKLKNGAKVLDKTYSNRTQADAAARSLMTQHKGVNADAYQSPFNNRFYVRIKEDVIREQDDQDHEVSMARGELEAIADKANQLASMLQNKSDEGNPLEAWVQSKITKAKDYINSVSDYLMYNPDMKQNEELEESHGPVIYTDGEDKIEKVGDKFHVYKGDKKSIHNTLDDAKSSLSEELEEARSLDDLKKILDHTTLLTSAEKNKIKDKEKTMSKDAYRKYLANMFSEEVIEEGYSQSLKQKAKELAKKFEDNMNAAVQAIEKLAKGLSNDPEVYKALKYYNEDKKLDEADNYPTLDINKEKQAAYRDPKKGEKKVIDPAPKIDESRMKEIDNMRKKGAPAEKIAKELRISVAAVKAILGEETELQEFSDTQIAQLKRAYSPLKGQKMSLNHANQLMGIFSKFDNNKNTLEKLVKANIPFVSDLAISRLISKHNYKADKLKTLKAGYMSEGTMKGGIVKYTGQSSSEYNKAKSAYKQFMSKPQPAKSAEDKVLPFIFDDELLDDLYVASKKNVSDVRPIVKKRLQALGIKEDIHEGARSLFETIQAVKNKAEKTGMPYSILKQVYDRGMAAWKGGHRPGATQQQWALARVNSFVTKSSGTWGGADSDLAAKVRKAKK